MYTPSDVFVKILSEFGYKIEYEDEQEICFFTSTNSGEDFYFVVDIEDVESDEDFVEAFSEYFDNFDYEEVVMLRCESSDHLDLEYLVEDFRKIEDELSDLLDSLERKKVIRFKTLDYASLEADYLKKLFEYVAESYEKLLKSSGTTNFVKETEELNEIKERFQSNLESLYRRTL